MAYQLFVADIRYFGTTDIWYPIYIGSTSPTDIRYPISDILAQPISDIRYFTDIPVLHHDILSQILNIRYFAFADIRYPIF